MNNEEVLLVRRKSLEKKKNTQENLVEELHRIKLEKVSLMFEISLLIHEKREVMKQIENGLKFRDELIVKKKNLESAFNKNKLNLSLYKNSLSNLDIELDALSATTNDFVQENQALKGLIDRISSELAKKRENWNEISQQAFNLERELIKKRDLLKDLTARSQDISKRIDEFSSGANLRKREIEDLDHKINEIDSSLNFSLTSLEKIKMDFDLIEKERDIKKEQLSKVDEERTKVIDKIDAVKLDVSFVKNELIDLSKKLLENSNDLEKLQEVEMVISLTLDHVSKEGDEFRARILATENKIENKKNELEIMTNKLKDQKRYLEALKNNDKNSNLKKMALLEMIERAKMLILSNQDFLGQIQMEVSEQDPPPLPKDN